MTIHHPLGADGLAILALTARSTGGRADGRTGGLEPDGPSPLAPKDWARVARALAAAGATPADLLGREAAELEHAPRGSDEGRRGRSQEPHKRRVIVAE